MTPRHTTSSVRIIAPVVFILSLLALWWFVTATGIVEAWRLPSPVAVLNRAFDLLATGDLWMRLAVTSIEAFFGSLVALGVALPLGWLIYRNLYVQAAVEPFLGATQAIPAIALAPLLVMWLGFGIGPIIALCALIVFFPILVSTVLGLRHLDSEVLEAASLDGASGWTMARDIELPLAAPSILSGLRNGFTLSITGAIVGEMVMGGMGLGQVLVQSRNNNDIAAMFVIIFLLCCLATAAYLLVYRFERRYRRANSLQLRQGVSS